MEMHPENIRFNQLCAKCQAIFSKDGAWAVGGTEVIRKHHNLNALRHSAQHGCHFCAIALDEILPDRLLELLDAYEKAPETACDQIGILVNSNSGNRYANGETLCQVFLRKESLSKAVPAGNNWTFSFNMHNAAFPTSTSTSSQASWDQVERWIDECTENHEQCKMAAPATEETPWLPTRLLDVGSDVNDSSIRLCDSVSLPTATKYVTLSHCWGGTVSPKLLVTNLSTFQQKIPVRQLSQTFADAVLVTRRLGKRYIWIDALCIIQDSKSDWAKEAVLMGRVYARSFVNIAATASTDGQGGLFRARNPLSIAQFRVVPTWDDYDCEPLIHFDTNAARLDVQEGPLNQRAWVVQERLLAPRAIQFTRRQIYWECPQLTANESYPMRGLNQTIKKWVLGPTTTAGLPNDINEDSSDRSLHFYNVWNNIVEFYTASDLTFKSDKLVAIAGIAENIKNLWGDESVSYYAGMWSFGLPKSLVWETSTESQSTRRANDYRAPSWSWASIDGAVLPAEIYDLKTHHDAAKRRVARAQVLDVQLRPVGLDTAQAISVLPGTDYGGINEGHLFIRAPIAEMTCKINPSALEEPERYQNRISRTPKVYLLAGEALASDQRFFPRWDDWSWHVLAEIHALPFYLLAIEGSSHWGMEESNARRGQMDKFTVGLILRPTKKARGQYERLGSFAMTSPTGYDLLERAFRSQALGDELFVDRDDEDTYTVWIV